MSNPRSTARIGGHPIHVMLVPFPIVCFVLTFLSDLIYWRTAAMQWANMSAWLLTIGLVLALFAVIAGLIDFLGEPRIRDLAAVYVHAAGNAVALVLAIMNAFIHTRDAYTSVVPTGLILSGLTVLVLLLTGWMGWDMVYRLRVGVAEEGRR